MKILYCIPTLGDGGAERQLSYLGAELSRFGHEVHVACSRGGTNLERLRSMGVEWHRLGGMGNRDPVIFFRLIRLMRRLRPDVVQTILTPMDIMGGAAALLTGTPWILKESSSAPLYGRRLRYRWRIVLGRMADGIVSNSAGGDAYWRSVGATRLLGSIPNGIPLDEIELAQCDIGPEPLDGDPKVLLFAGRLDEGKNVENLIDALSRITHQLAFVALICGDGPRRTSLERLARERGVAHRLVFLGYVSKLWSLMKQADAVVSLSRFEGRPNVVIEAMASGCPLVVSDIPAHREILDDSTAALVDPDKPAQAANAILEALHGSGRTTDRASAAQARAAQWTVSAAARQQERVYQYLLSGVLDLRGIPIIATAESTRASES